MAFPASFPILAPVAPDLSTSTVSTSQIFDEIIVQTPLLTAYNAIMTANPTFEPPSF